MQELPETTTSLATLVLLIGAFALMLDGLVLAFGGKPKFLRGYYRGVVGAMFNLPIAMLTWLRNIFVPPPKKKKKTP